MRLVLLLVATAMVTATLITVAFGNEHAPSPRVVVDWILDEEETAVLVGTETPDLNLATEIQATWTAAPPTATQPQHVAGFSYPILGACLPVADSLLPGAPREYRDGVHEGVDFYGSDNCTAIGLGTEVLAAAAGTVVRADSDYTDLTAADLAGLYGRIELEGGDAPGVTDAFRGRQVWIDHGSGVVTRYAHLSGIADSILVGATIRQGAVIGYVGDSGTPESVTDPGTQVHLHFEIRLGETWLGQGLGPGEVRALYVAALSQ